MKQKHRTADGKKKELRRKKVDKLEIVQWTAKAYQNCSTNKRANRQSNALNYLLSLATLQNLQTHTV